MKLKHNSIRSGSRVKSSALIVCWQALPALQQTQCYQGTEGRFVCTGRASCCVRPACPGPGEHRDARPRTGAAGGSGRQAAPCQHWQGARLRDGVLWLGATSRLSAQLSGHRTQVGSLPVNVTVEYTLWRDRAAKRQGSGLMFLPTGTYMAPSPTGAAQLPTQGGCRAGRAEHPDPQRGGTVAHQHPPDPARAPNPTATPGPHPALISACCLAVPRRLQGQRSPLCPSLYTPVIFNSAYANPESGMSSGRGPRGNGHGANFLPFLPLFLYNIQQRFSSTA